MSRVRVDFTAPLSTNLEALGITRERDEEYPHSRRWVLNGTVIGEFNAHEGWAVLRHYDVCRNWHIAIRNGMGEMYEGYDVSEKTWEEYLDQFDK